MALEFRDILVQRRGVCSVFLKDHSLGGEPSNSSAGDISLFEVFVELCNKVWVCFQGYSSGCVDNIFMECSSPGEGRSFDHIRQNE